MDENTGKVSITIEFNYYDLSGYDDGFLALLWHLAQANPADGFDTKEPGEIAERIGREIVRRWLKGAPVEVWRHQGHHYHAKQLGRFARFEPGPGNDFSTGRWVPRADGPDVRPPAGVRLVDADAETDPPAEPSA